MMFEEYNYLFKIVVIGDSGVGKTNLVSQFVDQKFIEDEKPTVGVQFSSKVIQIESHDIRCQIWDTAGQQRFRAVTKAYYNGAVGALVVFDLTNSKSFENISKWIEEAQNNTKKDTVILMVGNKDDLVQRQVSQSKVQQLISRKKNKMLYIETSALTGHNVKDAFKALVQAIYQQKNREIQIMKKQNTIIVQQDKQDQPKNQPPSPKNQKINSNSNNIDNSNIIHLKSSVINPVRVQQDGKQKKKKKCC